MSGFHIGRLRAVESELDIAKTVFAHSIAGWNDKRAIIDFAGLTMSRVRNVEANLERTYIIRLTAEFEALLRDHLRTNHPRVQVRRDVKVDWLISRVRKLDSLVIDPILIQQIADIRDYRNLVAHGVAAPAAVAFDVAVNRYNTFLGKIPDPIR